MTFTEAALLVLRLAGKPLHYKEITDVAIERSLLSHVGKSPEVTMGARLAAQVKNADKSNPLKRVKPGVFALSDWDDKTVERGLEDRTPALQLIRKAEEQQGIHLEDLTVNEPGVSEVLDEAGVAEGETTESPEAKALSTPDKDEQHRAELSAGASDLFASEDDDDQPIFGGSNESTSEKLEADDKGDGKRRRRRRRGRGRRDEETSTDDESDDLPGYTVSDAEPEEVLRAEEFTPVLEEAASQTTLNFSDALYEALSKQGGSRAGVAAQTLADSLRKKFKNETGLNGPALLAVAVTDNLLREKKGQVPRFRVQGAQLALNEWGGDRKFSEKTDELGRVVEQIQKATLRSLTEELRRLPQRAVGELVLVLLERMGVEGMSVVKRPGAHGSELHLAGTLTHSHALRIPVAIVVRRDARDIGREKVTELRGGLHHYGSSTAGWLITTGQVLSGAKEEAQAPGATPVTLTGRTELADLFLAFGIGVRSQRIEIPMLDVALFDGLSGR